MLSGGCRSWTGLDKNRETKGSVSGADPEKLYKIKLLLTHSSINQDNILGENMVRWISYPMSFAIGR